MRFCSTRDVSERISLSYPQAFIKLISFSGPNVIARLSSAIPGILDAAIILKKLGPDAISAGPSISIIVGSVLGISGSAMSPAGYYAAKFAGEGEELLAQIKIDPSKKEENEIKAAECFKKVGEISRQCWVLDFPLSMGSGVILFFIGPITHFIQPKIPLNVINMLQSFLRYYSLSPFPTLGMSIGRNAAAAVGKPWVSPAFSIIHLGTSVVIGYPLAFYSALMVEGPGIGVSISALASCLALQLWLSREEYQKYGLGIKNFGDGFRQDFGRLLRESAKISIFTAMELSNIIVPTALAIRLGPEMLQAIQPSLQLIIPFSFPYLALAQSAGVLIGRIMGNREAAIKSNDRQMQIICENNVRKIGNTNILIGAFFALLVGGMVAGFAEPFSNFYSTATPKSVNLLYICCALILFNGIRILGGGNLRGFHDTRNLSLSSSLMFVLSIVPSLAAVLSNDNASYFWLFAPSLVGSAISAFAVLGRWFYISSDANFRKTAELIRESLPLLGENNSSLFASTGNSSVNSNNTVEILSDTSDVERDLARDREYEDLRKSRSCCVML